MSWQIDYGLRPGIAMTAPKKTGRPRSAHPLRYQVRHSAEQIAAWQAAADRDQRELQNWIRVTLDNAARERP